jgi:hypothetical protein
MTPAGYMAKHVEKKPDWLKASQVDDVYSVGSCVSDFFADYVSYWRHNGYWLFDSPEIIRTVAAENSIPLEGMSLFYYEAHEAEFDNDHWQEFAPDPSLSTNVIPPSRKRLEGFDVVSFSARNIPECCPLSCNSMAEELHTNAHCLFESFVEAETNINKGAFNDCEPGPYRILSVHSVDWP